MYNIYHGTDSTVKDFDGKLYIVDPWESDYKRPVRYKPTWPTGLFAADYPDLVNQPCTNTGGGVYRIVKTGQYIATEYRAETKMALEYVEERKIPQPPMTHEYKNGRWRA